MVQVCTHRKGFETGDRQCDLSLGTRREAWQDLAGAPADSVWYSTSALL